MQSPRYVAWINILGGCSLYCQLLSAQKFPEVHLCSDTFISTLTANYYLYLYLVTSLLADRRSCLVIVPGSLKISIDFDHEGAKTVIVNFISTSTMLSVVSHFAIQVDQNRRNACGFVSRLSYKQRLVVAKQKVTDRMGVMSC